MELIIFWLMMNWWYFARQLADGSIAVTFLMMAVQKELLRPERNKGQYYPRTMKNF